MHGLSPALVRIIAMIGGCLCLGALAWAVWPFAGLERRSQPVVVSIIALDLSRLRPSDFGDWNEPPMPASER
jgi:hypothetical protein